MARAQASARAAQPLPLLLLLSALLLLEGAWRAGAEGDGGLWEREPLTTSGSLRGRVLATPHGPVAQFLGVRYAEAPLPRFSPARAHRVPDTSRVVDADAYAPACVQPPHRPDFMPPEIGARARDRPVSEDCLFLNVFAPAGTPPPGGRAMLLWLPGEGFDFADAGQFDASALAARGDIVVVTVAYRVAAFGFLSAGNSSLPGNAALHDVLVALRWARTNAAAFGADARRLALGGRFSGAMLAALAAASPAALERPPPAADAGVAAPPPPQPLVSRLLLQSAGPYPLEADPANSTAAIAARSGCRRADFDQTLACLRALPAEALLAASIGLRWRAALDGALVGSDVVRAARRGAFPAELPVLLGDTSNEGALCLLHHYSMETAFAPLIAADNITRKEFAQLIREHLLVYLNVQDQALADAATHEYKVWAETGRNFRALFLRFCGALYVRARGEQLARALARRGARVWRYEFAHRPTSSPHPAFLQGGSHGDDVPFALGMLDAAASDAERALADRLMGAIGAFVSRGNPNAEGSEQWPPFLDNSRQMLVFDVGAPTTRTTDFLSQDVDFWGQLAPSILRSGQRGPKTPGRSCAKQQKNVPRACEETCSVLAGLVALSIILGVALLLMAAYLLYTARNRSKGLLAQEHLPQ